MIPWPAGAKVETTEISGGSLTLLFRAVAPFIAARWCVPDLPERGTDGIWRLRLQRRIDTPAKEGRGV